MKVKFNKFERIAGIFVLVAFGGFISSAVVVAIKRGWFESKMELQTSFTNGDGLYPGMPVQMSGLRAGAVSDVILESDNKVTVKFHVSERFFDKVREDSVVHTIRPFIIGDKAIDLTIGSPQSKQVSLGQLIPSEETFDLMDMVGGRRMAGAMKTLSGLAENLQILLEAFRDPRRAKTIVGIFDDLGPLLKDAHVMTRELVTVSRQLNTRKNLQHTLENAIQLTGDLNRVIPQVVKIAERSPQSADQLLLIVDNLAKLTTELAKILPTLTAIAPELPRASRRAIEAMDEAVVLLKAMQKSFLMSGNVKEVREEEKKHDEEQKRLEAQRKQRAEADEKKAREPAGAGRGAGEDGGSADPIAPENDK